MDRIRAADAEIRWDDKRGPSGGPYRVSEVLVFDRSRPEDERSRLSASAGACCSDWLTGEDPRSTPEGVFAGWLVDGFLTSEVCLQALEQLGKIDTAEWARTMHAALERRLLVEGVIAEAE